MPVKPVFAVLRKQPHSNYQITSVVGELVLHWFIATLGGPIIENLHTRGDLVASLNMPEEKP